MFWRRRKPRDSEDGSYLGRVLYALACEPALGDFTRTVVEKALRRMTENAEALRRARERLEAPGELRPLPEPLMVNRRKRADERRRLAEALGAIGLSHEQLLALVETEIKSLRLPTPNDDLRRELRELEAQAAAIERAAEEVRGFR